LDCQTWPFGPFSFLLAPSVPAALAAMFTIMMTDTHFTTLNNGDMLKIETPGNLLVESDGYKYTYYPYPYAYRYARGGY